MGDDVPPPLPIAWDDLQVALHVDGSWRDLIIESNEDSAWQRALDFSRSLVAHGKATMETEPEPLPAGIADIFKLWDASGPWMHLFVGPLQINCHFFGGYIEFDIDPSEAATTAGAAALVSFVEGLGQAVGQPVNLTEENMREWVWYAYNPTADEWRRGPMFEGSIARDIRRR
jgi:hypothetical protein